MQAFVITPAPALRSCQVTSASNILSAEHLLSYMHMLHVVIDPFKLHVFTPSFFPETADITLSIWKPELITSQRMSPYERLPDFVSWIL